MVAGTVVGVGLSNAWWTGATAAALPAATIGAAATGGVAGVGAAALVHAAVTPCVGFDALFNNFLTASAGRCVNGQPVAPRYIR